MPDLTTIKDFHGGKVSIDNRQALAGTLSLVRGQAVGMDAGDYEVVLVPAGTLIPAGETVAKFQLVKPPVGLVNNVVAIVHAAHANPNPVVEEKVK